ncbi:MAG: endonuclease domain-containing protein [Desulfobulbaceae bacterium]|nr:endonuclease domain-containing protein [Desulfobulbaceae bacterium]
MTDSTKKSPPFFEALLHTDNGKPCAIFADEPEQVLLELENTDLDHFDNLRIIQVPLELSVVNEGINKTLSALAGLAQTLQPEWESNTSATDESVNHRWRKRGIELCQRGRPPLPSGFSEAQQARQLTLCLNQGPLVILLFPQQDEPTETQLYSLARVSEWLAIQTKSKIGLLLRAKHLNHPALDSISYGAVTLAAPRVDPKKEIPSTPAAWIFPYLGKPHPCSPGEQILAKLIQADNTISTLFHYNYRIQGCRGSNYICDLVWPSGQLVIEIDGYGFHSSQPVFCADRKRDRELLLTGYRVMRLPHNEVINNPQQAITEIKDMVRFIRSQISSPQ